MLRNRRKNARKKNSQNTRARNPLRYAGGNNDFVVTSNTTTWDSLSSESEIDDSEVSSDSSVSPERAVERKPVMNRRRRSTTKSKSNRRKATRSNRNQYLNDLEAAGPSSASSSSQNNSRTRGRIRGNKRKMKENSRILASDDSSDDVFSGPVARNEVKRRRQINSDSDDSDSSLSIIHSVVTRRNNIINSDSSSSDDILRIHSRFRSNVDSTIWINSDSSSNSSSIDFGNVAMIMDDSTPTSSNASFTSIYSNTVPVPRDVFSSSTTDSADSNTQCSTKFVSVREQVLSSDSESSSDSDSEKCAICLKKFRNQQIGTPSDCEHTFCVKCIQEWSKSSTTCPVDRSSFNAIIVRNKVGGSVVERIEVQSRNFEVVSSDFEEVLINETITCVNCGSGDDEDTLLLCDHCNMGYHMACLVPPLQVIPPGSWYCPMCEQSTRDNNSDDMNETMRRIMDRFPFSSTYNPSALNHGRNIVPRLRARPRSRAPFRSRPLRNRNTRNDLTSVIEAIWERQLHDYQGETTNNLRSCKQRNDRRRTLVRNAAQVSRNVVSALSNNLESVRRGERSNGSLIRPSEIHDLVFPSFSLFGDSELSYFSDEYGENGDDGEVAIMSRVRNEYSASRIVNRKNIVSSLMDYRTADVASNLDSRSETSTSLLDSIMENQTLWHSKNVDISSKKDGSLEIKLKGKDERPDLTKSNHSSKEIPLFPSKSGGSSSDTNKSHTNNSRYTNFGGNSNGNGSNGSSSFSQASSSINSLNSTSRPGLSNLFGNTSSSVDVTPFRGTAPIRFRMNPPRPGVRKSNFSNRNTANSSMTNFTPSPRKSSGHGGGEEDLDLYDDIVENEKSTEVYSSLEPPPEPPALLIGSDSSSDEENGLVIDDKAPLAANKSNIYDPTEPNEDSDTESNQKNRPAYMSSPSYGGTSMFGPHLPLPEPPALPIELESVNNSDSEDDAECPNMNLYSSTSISLASSIQDIPVPDVNCSAISNAFLDSIPVPKEEPTVLLENSPNEQANLELYSPSKSANSDSDSSVEEVEVNTFAQIKETEPIAIPIREFSNIEPVNLPEYGPQQKDENYISSEDEAEVEECAGAVRKIDGRNSVSRRRSDDENEVTVILDEPAVGEKTELSFVCDNENEGDVVILNDSGELPEKHELDDKIVVIDDKMDDTDDEEDVAEKSTAYQVLDEDNTEKDESLDDLKKSNSDGRDGTNGSDAVKADSSDVTASATLLPSEDLDPVSDAEENDFGDDQRGSKDKRRRRKKLKKRTASSERSSKSEHEVDLEEGEIKEQSSRNKRPSTQSEKSEIRVPDKKKSDRRNRDSGKENKDAKNDSDLTWKKISKSTKERNYRDGKAKPDKLADRNKEKDGTSSKKEKRREIVRYDVRKVISDKPSKPRKARKTRDEFGRDISPQRSRSKSRSRSKTPKSRSRSHSPAKSYSSRRRSKGPLRRSPSPDDRWIDWSPVRGQHRSRSRSRRSRSRSKNRSHLSSDRYKNKSKGDRRKRRRSVSTSNHYSPGPKKHRRSKERVRRSTSFEVQPNRDAPDYYYERSWTRSPTYVNYTPEPEAYMARYERSPSIIDQTHMPMMSPEPVMMSPNAENLTVIVPNTDAARKKHKKKKKKKKKQPSKEVFTSGDNIVVSVNFDDNQKIISAKSSKRKHGEEKKKKKNTSSRKKRKQTLHVSDEVLNAKPVAVIDLNTSPCKEMSPVEVISLTDSGDETNANEKTAPPTETSSKSPEHRPYVMTNAGPKTPPEPSIKFTVAAAGSLRPLPTNPIFEVEDNEGEDESTRYKGPNTPPEPSNQTSNATMYDPFEPTKSRSPSPAPATGAGMYKERSETTPDKLKTIDMFADDNDKSADVPSAKDDNAQEQQEKETTASATTAEEAQPTKLSPVKEVVATVETTNDNNNAQVNGVNTLVLDLSSLGDDFVPKSSIPLVKTSQGKYEFQSTKTPDKPITVVIAQQSSSKPQPQQVMVTPTRQVPTKPVEPIKQPIFPDILPWKLPPLSQATFTALSPAISSVPPTTLHVTPSKPTSVPVVGQNGNQDDTSFALDDSPYSPASSEGDDLFEPPPLNAGSGSPRSRQNMSGVNSYKNRMDALFNSSPVKKMPRSGHPKPVSAVKGSKKIKTSSKRELGIRADDEQLKILDDVPNSAVELAVKEKFLKKLQRQERVVEEVKVVLKPHYAKKHISKEEYKDILRRAVPKICHNKAGDINPSKIQSLVEAYVKKIRHSKKKSTTMSTLPSSTSAPLFPPMTGMANAAKPMNKKPKNLWS